MSDANRRRPVQAGDYGKAAPSRPAAPVKKAAEKEDGQQPDTDGRKTLALWSH